jgi:hypothetical protein
MDHDRLQGIVVIDSCETVVRTTQAKYSNWPATRQRSYRQAAPQIRERFAEQFRRSLAAR